MPAFGGVDPLLSSYQLSNLRVVPCPPTRHRRAARSRAAAPVVLSLPFLSRSGSAPARSPISGREFGHRHGDWVAGASDRADQAGLSMWNVGQWSQIRATIDNTGAAGS